MSPFTSSAPSAKASRASQSECALFHSSARSLKTGRSVSPWRSSSSGTSSSTRPAANPVTTATSSTPTAARFARTRSRIVPLSPSGRSVFGSSRVSGPRRLPGPAASTTAFTSRPGAWDDGSIMAPRPMSAAKAERKRAGSSFVIATRNRPDFLRDAVESLAGADRPAGGALHRRLERRGPGAQARSRSSAPMRASGSTTSTRRRAASPCSGMSVSTGRAATPSS